jgi:AcrR family transcriptional regulator
VGRPAQHTRSEITAVALDIADRESLDAVSMRRLAAELGTGAASLYRYVATREELLDLMADATGAEYELPDPTGDWLADLVTVGEQTRAILRRRRWLAGQIVTHPVIGPNGVALIEHVLTVLAPHPADLTTKFEAFALLNGLTATFVLHEFGGGEELAERNVAYLTRPATSGEHPRLAGLLGLLGLLRPGSGARTSPTSPAPPADRYPDSLARVLSGLLGPAPRA